MGVVAVNSYVMKTTIPRYSNTTAPKRSAKIWFFMEFYWK